MYRERRVARDRVSLGHGGHGHLVTGRVRECRDHNAIHTKIKKKVVEKEGGGRVERDTRDPPGPGPRQGPAPGPRAGARQ